MAKDSYWFKHDSSAGRGTRMRKMAFIYGHWGKGIYWDVIEMLRDQDGYEFQNDETSLDMLCDLIGCKDTIKFKNWVNDCIRLDLIQSNETHIYSDVLTENMETWETKKGNGSKGGRPKKTKPITETITETKANQNHKRIEENITEDKRIDINSFFESLLNGSDLETIAMNNKITLEGAKKCVEIFRPKAELSYQSYAKFVAHFKNWLAKNPYKDPLIPTLTR